MRVYTVAKPVGTKDVEFEAYARLLLDKGVDISNIPRTQEPGTENRWLYVWKTREEAEQFKEELIKRTRQRDWYVREFDTKEVHNGPFEPLTIYIGRQADGFTYKLHPNSKALIGKKFPGMNRVESIFVAVDTQQDVAQQFEQTWLDELVVMLTGVSREKLMQVGGYQIYDPLRKKVVAKHFP